MNLKTVKYCVATLLVSLFTAGSLLAQSADDTSFSRPAPTVSPIAVLIELAILVFMIVCGWKIYVKAGQPGWAFLIPIYNGIVFLKIVGRPIWWIILLLIPFVNIVMAVILAIDLAKCFGKSAGYGVGLFLLPIVFYPMLAFDDAKYQGRAAA